MTLRRDAIARQTSAWLFTLSEDENRVIANVVDRVRGGVPQYGHLDIRADKRDWQNEAGAEILDFLFYVGCEWLKQRLARVDAIDSAPSASAPPAQSPNGGGGTFCQGGGTVDAPRIDPSVPNNGRRDTGAPRLAESVGRAGSTPAPDTAPAHPSNGSHRVGGGTYHRGVCTGDDFCAECRRLCIETLCDPVNAGLRELAAATPQVAAPGGFEQFANLVESECAAAEAHYDAKLAEMDRHGYDKPQVAAPGVADDHTLWSSEMVDGLFDGSDE